MKTDRILYIIALFIFLISCSEDAGMSMKADTGGKGGSMARFTISGNYLYTVDTEQLKVFDIQAPANPEFVNNIRLGWGIETIFPYQQNLFIGTQFGMQVYNISDGKNPQFVTEVRHIYSCDPVVVEGNYAYVTLHSENSRCGRFTNELQVIDITNLGDTKIVRTYPMEKPLGLGIDNDILFVCDDGLKVYDASDVHNLQLLQYFNIEAYDVIPNNGLLIVTGDDGIYQYSYDGTELNLVSTISVLNSSLSAK